MNKLQEYIEKYKQLHDGTTPFYASSEDFEANKLTVNGENKKFLFDGAQFGNKFAKLIKHCIGKMQRGISLLDYGCGMANHHKIRTTTLDGKLLLEFLDNKVQCMYNYDPGVEVFKTKPPLGMTFDIVACSDVLEHVPEEYIPVVLAEISNYTKDNGIMLFTVSVSPGKKKFIDGEYFHITLKEKDWWLQQFKNYTSGKSFYFLYKNKSGEEKIYFNSTTFPFWDEQDMSGGVEFK